MMNSGVSKSVSAVFKDIAGVYKAVSAVSKDIA